MLATCSNWRQRVGFRTWQRTDTLVRVFLLLPMIHAALHGKLDCLGSEDALTCAVFTRLRYLPSQVLGEWLTTARNHADITARAALRTTEPVVEFWPSIKDTLRGQGSVEPDVILRFDDEVLVQEPDP